MPDPAKQLDPQYLKGEARTVALDVAAKKQLYLAPEALPAVDTVVDEQLPVIEKTWVDADRWRKHVRHVSSDVADTYVVQRIKRVDNKIDLLNRARKVLACYPYD